jgi:hypothetical protein
MIRRLSLVSLVAALLAVPHAARAVNLIYLQLEDSFTREDQDFRLVHRNGWGGGLGVNFTMPFVGDSRGSLGPAFELGGDVSGGPLTSTENSEGGILMRFRLQAGLGAGYRLARDQTVFALVGLHLSEDNARVDEMATGEYLRVGLLSKELELEAALTFGHPRDTLTQRELSLQGLVSVASHLGLLLGLTHGWDAVTEGSSWGIRVAFGFTPLGD